MCITTRPFGPGIDCAGPAGLKSGGRNKVHVVDTPLADFQIVIRQLTRWYPRSKTRRLCRGIDRLSLGVVRLYQGVGRCSSGPKGRRNACRWREPPVASPKKTKGPKGRYNPDPQRNCAGPAGLRSRSQFNRTGAFRPRCYTQVSRQRVLILVRNFANRH